MFDFFVGAASALAAVGFCAVMRRQTPAPADAMLVITLPSLLLLSNLALGVYSRHRRALARVKAGLLGGAIILSCGIAALCFQNRIAIVLWTLIATGPIVLARLLLGLQAGRHRRLAQVAINSRGPVLVLGGAGYIGSHTVDLLLRNGYDVRVLDRLMYGPSSLEHFHDNGKFSLIEGDATEISKLTAAMKDCSAVIHLAGLVGDPACAVNPEFTRHANIITTRMAREVAESMGVQRFIFASSCSVYGASDKEVSETDALNPVSLYAQTKIDSEQELLSVARDDFFVTVLRFATVFGDSARPRFDLVVNLFSAQAMTDGVITVIGPNQWRPFIHVRDLARAIVTTLKAPTSVVQSQIFNVGDRRLNMTILQAAEEIRDTARKYRPDVEISVTENPQDRRNYVVSFDKIRRILGFEAETLMKDGVREIVERFAANAYQHYRSPEYSNVAMTTKAVDIFQDPAQMAHLYAPLYVGR
jgi:nucleoside-diphosphate-sugar epimerase